MSFLVPVCPIRQASDKLSHEAGFGIKEYKDGERDRKQGE